jgi:purine nucleoside phosphorylase
MAAGIRARKLSHSEVIETTERVIDSFTALLREMIPLVAGRLVSG